jgi:hypothetical protein
VRPAHTCCATLYFHSLRSSVGFDHAPTLGQQLELYNANLAQALVLHSVLLEAAGNEQAAEAQLRYEEMKRDLELRHRSDLILEESAGRDGMIVLYVKDDGECWFSSVKVSGAAHGFYAWITIDFRAELAGLYRLAASLNPHMHSHFMEMALYVEVPGNYSECDDTLQALTAYFLNANVSLSCDDGTDRIFDPREVALQFHLQSKGEPVGTIHAASRMNGPPDHFNAVVTPEQAQNLLGLKAQEEVSMRRVEALAAAAPAVRIQQRNSHKHALGIPSPSKRSMIRSLKKQTTSSCAFPPRRGHLKVAR